MAKEFICPGYGNQGPHSTFKWKPAIRYRGRSKPAPMCVVCREKVARDRYHDDERIRYQATKLMEIINMAYAKMSTTIIECELCENVKPVMEYSKDLTSVTGYLCICKVCERRTVVGLSMDCRKV